MKILMLVPVVALMVSSAHARTVKCELTIAGHTYIDGPCEFTSIGDGSFIITGENGFSHTRTAQVLRCGDHGMVSIRTVMLMMSWECLIGTGRVG